MVTAVITGASSGLGKEYINAIIAEYPTVDVFWLVARRKELLKEIADEHPDKTIAAISLDLSQQESLEIFEKLLKENEPEIKVLVNNAGFGKCGDFFTSNRASQMGMVDVNCRALTAITRLCLPYGACAPFLSFEWEHEGQKFEVNTHLIGSYNMKNALAAITHS